MLLRKSRIKARIWAPIWMVTGTTFALLSYAILNTSQEKDKKQDQVRSIAFEVKRDLPKPKVVKKKQKKSPSRPKSAPPPPTADLNLEFGNLDLGAGTFASSEIGEVDAGLLGDMKNVVMNSDMVDVPPRARFRTAMTYPARAKAKEIEGFVTLSLLINQDGKVETVKVLEAEPIGVFEKTVTQTIKKWVFEPAKYKGDTVQTWANQTIRFELG